MLEEHKLKISIEHKGKKKKKKKSKVKFYVFEKLKCQGKKELRFLKECFRYKKTMPTKAKRIFTPYGFYTPDFEYPDRYIEIKSLETFKVCLGLKSYKGLTKLSDKQFKKIKWVAKNIKPLEFIIYVGKNEYRMSGVTCPKNITITWKGGKIKK